MSFYRQSLSHRFEQFDLSALTLRRTILDPAKLEYLNKNHLMETWSRPDGLNALADRVVGLVREAFPDKYGCVACVSCRWSRS